jgi:hypothetical protein
MSQILVKLPNDGAELRKQPYWQQWSAPIMGKPIDAGMRHEFNQDLDEEAERALPRFTS